MFNMNSRLMLHGVCLCRAFDSVCEGLLRFSARVLTEVQETIYFYLLANRHLVLLEDFVKIRPPPSSQFWR